MLVTELLFFYDDHISQLDFPRILTHEVGHIVLGHLNNVDDIYAKERDSDCFAEELLAYVPKRIFPTIGIVAVIMIFVGVLGYFSADKSNDNDIFFESNTYDEISISSTTSIDGNPNVVYITKFGNKYHITGCQYINSKDDLIEISIKEAEKAGYKPCEVCFGK